MDSSWQLVETFNWTNSEKRLSWLKYREEEISEEIALAVEIVAELTSVEPCLLVKTGVWHVTSGHAVRLSGSR